MKTAHWRSHCSADWPKPAVSWLRTRGSLTVRLQRLHGSFRVQLRKQGCGPVLSDEAALIGVKPGRHARLRQVTLWAGGQPRVVAHTAVKWMGQHSDWPFWRHLGTRSLGSVLFRDRTVKRGLMQFARLSQRHPLARQAAGIPHTGVAPRHWFARRAVYRRASGLTPLVVTEVFVSVDGLSATRSDDGM